jgi:hypothetical protein
MTKRELFRVLLLELDLMPGFSLVEKRNFVEEQVRHRDRTKPFPRPASSLTILWRSGRLLLTHHPVALWSTSPHSPSSLTILWRSGREEQFLKADVNGDGTIDFAEVQPLT